MFYCRVFNFSLLISLSRLSRVSVVHFFVFTSCSSPTRFVDVCATVTVRCTLRRFVFSSFLAGLAELSALARACDLSFVEFIWDNVFYTLELVILSLLS